MTRELLVKEGIFAGMSSGSAVVGALRWVGSRMIG
jgi:cysteine synthase